jgi:hypothetical protein
MAKKKKGKKKSLKSSRKRRKFQSGKLQKRIKKSQERSKGKFKNIINSELDIPVWRPKDGDHIIDIIPYFAGKKDPDPDARGEEQYTYEYYVHTNIGASNEWMLCPEKTYDKKCPICEHQQALFEKGRDKKAGKLWPKRRNLYNVVCFDRGEQDKGVQVWDVSWHYMEKKIKEKGCELCRH